MKRKSIDKPSVLHALAYAPPTLNGYAIRSHDLLTAQKKYGIAEPIAITLPSSSTARWHSDMPPQVVDNIPYYNASEPSSWPNSSDTETTSTPSSLKCLFPQRCWIEQAYKRIFKDRFKLVRAFESRKQVMKNYEHAILRIAQLYKVDIIHGHTPFYVGLPAMKAARRLGIPFIYEVRGLWEDSDVINGNVKEGSFRYKLSRHYETHLMKRADLVTAIGERLTLEVQERRGNHKRSVMYVPNAVGQQFIQKASLQVSDCARSREIHSKLQTLGDAPVVGYIGSLRPLEGVDDTARAIAIAKQQGFTFRFLVCSGQANQEELKHLCADLNITSQSLIVGPVTHDSIHGIYRLLDFFVVSRQPSRVTSLVPPIKPLEAMYLGIPTCASDLPALTESVTHESTGFNFKAGDPGDLAKLLITISSNQASVEHVVRRGAHFVRTERCWSDTVRIYADAYRQVRS